MTFIKWLLGLPLLFIVLWFAVINNDLAGIGLWPFWAEDDKVDVSLSVIIVFLFAFGFIMGFSFAWLSYAPRLSGEKRRNKKLSKEHDKLADKVADLEEDLNTLKKDGDIESETPQKSWSLFKKKTKKAKEPEVMVDIK